MLSQAVGYAAIALGYVASGGGKSILVKQIAEVSDIPGSYLAKIINSLARKGIVSTQRGIGGGVCLAKPATEVSLYDLCVALDDPSIQARCMLGTAECSDARACPAHQFWTGLRVKYIDYLRKMTVADVAAFELKRRARIGVGPGTGAFSDPAAFTAAISAAVTGQAKPQAASGQTELTVGGQSTGGNDEP